MDTGFSMFGPDNEYLIDTGEPDDPSVKVCNGWGTKEWIGHLRGKAKLCGPVNASMAAELRRQADVLERRMNKMHEKASRECPQ